MIARQLVRTLLLKGIVLWREGPNVRFRAPRGTLADEEIGELRSCKADVLAFLSEAGLTSGDLPLRHMLSRARALPLSFSQERLWVLHQMGLVGSAYNIPVAVEIEGHLDELALTESLIEIVRRHESLRTHFELADGAAVQVIDEPSVFSVRSLDRCTMSPQETDAELQALVRAETNEPFDLARGPLIRASLVKWSAAKHALLVTVHHIAADGWSMDVLMRELTALYRARLCREPDSLRPLQLQFADYALRQRRHLVGETLHGDLAYWKAQLGDAPAVLTLPFDYARPPVASFKGAVAGFEVPADLTELLQSVARQNGATLFMVLLTAFQVLLSRMSNQADVVVGTPVAGRPEQQLEDSIGFFANTLALRLHVDDTATYREHLHVLKDTALGAYAHEALPFEKLVQELRPERNLSHQPVFQVMFVLHNTPRDGALALQGATLRALRGAWESAKFDLTLAIETHDGRLQGMFEYATDLFAKESMQALSARYLHLLEQIVQRPESPVGELSYVTAAERRRLLSWRGGCECYAPSNSIADMFEAQVRRTADSTALVWGDERLSFTELNARSNRLAHLLIKHGVQPDERVAICLPRSVEMIVAVLSVLKAGAAYVPLDPGHPNARIQYILEEAGVRVVVAHDARENSVCFEGRHRIDIAVADRCGEGVPDPQRGCGPENLAYVLYTSGSTGKPKGVAMPQRALINLIEWHRHHPELGQPLTTLQFADLGFDVSFQEIFGTLCLGATLVLVSKEVRQDPFALLEYMATNHIERLFVPFVVLQEIAVAGIRVPQVPLLQNVITAGEQLRITPAIAAFFERVSCCTLYNQYGPTETHVVTELRLSPPATGWPAAPSIGRPIANAQVYILDETHQLTPVGVAGELYLGGASIARGYVGRDDLSAARFVRDPFEEDPARRLYRTGDLARWRSDGEIEFLGRIDQQVKVRGHRIELEEIEAALLACNGVRQAAVVLQDDPRQLVAYIVTEPAVERKSQQVREELRHTLPDYMIPSTCVFLSEMPLTHSRKIDRSLLPRPSRETAVFGEHVEPRSPAEHIIAQIWSRVLKLTAVGANDNFFELGGDSILAMRVISEMRDAFRADLRLRALFEAQTVSSLARLIEQQRVSLDLPERPPLQARSQLRAPLSFAQERLWTLEQMGLTGTAYNLPIALKLDGLLDAQALERALGEIVRRHESLRTHFELEDGRPIQVVNEPSCFAIRHIDGSALACSQSEAQWQHVLFEDAGRPFDLSAGPLMRATLLHRDSHTHVLLVTLHHAVSDGWSIGVLMRELSALYRAFCLNESSPLPELEVQYADFAVWQRAWLRGEVLERQLSYWRGHLEGAPPTIDLPADRARPPTPTFKGSGWNFEVSASITQGLTDIARSEGATLFTVLLAAYQVFLSKLSGQRDVVVGTPMTGREDRLLDGLIGFFVNTLALRAQCDPQGSFVQHVLATKRIVSEAFANHDAPFERVVHAVKPARDLSRQPIFQVMFALENASEFEPMLSPEIRVTPLDTQLASAKFDLTTTMQRTTKGLQGTFEYAIDLFEPDTITNFATSFVTLLERLVAHPSRPLGQVSMCSANDVQRALMGWGSWIAHYPQKECLHDLIARQAQRTPAAVAVSFQGNSVTYGELDALAQKLGDHLVGLAVGPDVLVALRIERSIEMIVAILGVLKAGGAYVPIDPSYPAERLRLILADTAASVLITQRGLQELQVEDRPETVVYVDAQLTEIPQCIGLRAKARAQPHNLAYCIYTSGSTGMPKGTLVTHENVLRLFAATNRKFAFCEQDVWSLFHSYAFDFSVWELFGALLHGGRLTIVPFVTSRSPQAFHEFLGAEGVTVLNQTPSAFRLLAPIAVSAAAIPKTLRLVIFGGEALDAHALETWVSTFGDAKPMLVNMYGITETTVHVTCQAIALSDIESDRRIPIGAPLDDLNLYILDDFLNLTPTGVVGELYVAGAGLARGYLNQPALTAERFLADPFASEPGSRMYATGDRARRRADGAIQFLGRGDHQVKLRGHRIELGEIEACLRRQADVADCVVCMQPQGEDHVLVAWVVPRRDAVLNEAGLREQLSTTLPSVMVPTAIVAIEALPLTENGKLDLRKLPTADGRARQLSAGYSPPITPLQEALAAIWRSVLRMEQVGIQDNFFALGGDSIRALQVVREAAARHIPLTTAQLYEAQTIANVERAFSDKLALPPQQIYAPLHLADVDRRAVINPPADLTDVYALTTMQQIMVEEYEKDRAPRCGVYHVQQSFRLQDAEPCAAAMQRALQALVGAYPVLRTTLLRTHGGTLVQGIRATFEVALEEHDLRHEQVEAQYQLIEAARIQDRLTPFSVDRHEPLFRFQWFRTASCEFELLLSIHHIIDDGWGNQYFLGQLFELYARAKQGAVSLPPRPNVFKELVALERQMSESTEAAAFWRAQLLKATDRSILRRARATEMRDGRHSFAIDANMTCDLRELARRLNVTLKAVLLNAYLEVLSSELELSTLTVGVVCNGRSAELSDPLQSLGLFWNLAPLHGPPAAGARDGRILAVHRQLIEVERFALYPLTRIASQCNAQELFFATFNFVHFHNAAETEDVGAGRMLRETYLDRFHFPVNHLFGLHHKHAGIYAHTEYDARYFTRDQIEALDQAIYARLREYTFVARDSHRFANADLRGTP